VAYLFMKLPVGGAEDLVRSWIHRLPEPFEGLICCVRELGTMGSELRALGNPISALGVGLKKRFSLAVVRRLRAWLAENRIAIVHGHNYHADLYGRLAARPLRLPYFMHIHNVYRRRKLHRAFLNRVLARWTDKILCVSEQVARDVRRVDRIPKRKIEVMLNAIDLREFRPAGPRAGLRKQLGLRSDEFLLGSVGSLTGQKNQAALLEAVARLIARGLPVRCVICGEGPLRDSLDARIRQLRLQGKVTLLGVRRPIAPVLRDLDLFVMPSLYEGAPLALLQAMACGVPAAAADTDGIVRTTGPDHPGLMPADQPERIADKIQSFLHDPEGMRALANYQLRAIVPRFGLDQYIERLTNLYRQALRSKRPTRREGILSSSAPSAQA